MPKPVLAIDIDEVLFPFAAELLRRHNARNSTNHTVEQVVDFEYRFWGVNREEGIERVHEFSRQDHLPIEPIEKAKEALQRLGRQYRIVIVTSRDPEFEKGTLAWLEHHIPGLYDEVILTGNRFSGRPYRSKVGVCQEIGAVALIDDQLYYAEEAARQGVRCLLFGDYHWNQAEELPEGVQRVRDWDEVVTLLEKKEYLHEWRLRAERDAL